MAVTMNSSRRRLVYGANVVLTIGLAAVLLYLVVWAAGRIGGRIDLTSSGVNSLSPRTVALVKDLQKPVKITALYTTALKEIRTHAEKHKQRISDLLDLYQGAAGGKITANVIDPSDNPKAVNELLKGLATKSAYKDEAAPHAAALESFPQISQQIIALCQDELAKLEGAAKSDPKLNRTRELAIIARNMRTVLEAAKKTEEDLAELKTAELPRYQRAIELVRDFFTQTRSALQEAQGWLTGDAQAIPGLSPAAKEMFAGATERYKAVLAALDEQITKTQDLKRVHLEDLYDALVRGQSVLVESDDAAEVLSEEDVSPFRTDRNRPPPQDGDQRDFAGEQAISSAILKLTKKERTAVIFTRFGGQAMLTPDFSQMNPANPQAMQAPYETINQLLDKENFIPLEWDVQTQPAPPSDEKASRTIFVVFPPEPPRQPNPMQPAATPPISPQQKQAILDAVAQSKMAIFMTGWEPPASQFVPTPGKYEFGEYLQSTWGIDVRYTHLAVHFMPNPQKQGVWVPANRNALMLGSPEIRFTDHAIGRPLQALPVGFGSVSPLALVQPDARPKDVTIETIAEVSATEDVWAFDDINRVDQDLQKNEGTRRYENDIPAPFPVAMSATNADGAKLVVFASAEFISDRVVSAGQLVMVGGMLSSAQLYPANTDLFINSLHWLSGDSERIAVGPRTADVPRLDKLKEGPEATFCRVFLVGIWPALGLVAGAVAWFIRRG